MIAVPAKLHARAARAVFINNEGVNKMKTIISIIAAHLILWGCLFIAANASAGEFEIRKTDVNMTWGKKGDFDMTLYQIGYAHYFGDIGLRAMVGESDTVTNKGEWKGVTNQMQDVWTLNIHKRFRIAQGITGQVGYNFLSEYKEVVNGEPKPDTGTGPSIAMQQRFGPHMSMKLSYDRYYKKKYHLGGDEVTEGVGLSIVWNL